uniref:Uncharacterized protein n=1 Tax=Arundo donax TaxID=35708 RepID=A0A0A9CDJ4_ARUDO
MSSPIQASLQTVVRALIKVWHYSGIVMDCDIQ